jgi:NAD-dependent dihydropyrimidine dehydrogenase PreA subunit
MEQALATALARRSGVGLAVVPPLYDVTPDGPAMQFLHGVRGEMIVLEWLYPRAAYWMLSANHVCGRMGHTSFFPEEELDALPPPPPNMPDEQRHLLDLPNRTLWCIDLRDHDRSEPVLAEVERIMAAVFGAPVPAPTDMPAGPANSTTLVEEVTQPRWYPVIDFSRCNHCQDCVKFCEFKVYGVDDAGMLLVLRPDDCFNRCAACARICPSGAIQLPHHCYPAIAGDPSAAREGMKSNPTPSPHATSPEDLAGIEMWRAIALWKKLNPDKPQGKNSGVGKNPISPPHTRQQFSLGDVGSHKWKRRNGDSA